MRVRLSPVRQELGPAAAPGAVGPAQGLRLRMGKGYVLRASGDIVMRPGPNDPDARDVPITRDRPLVFVADCEEMRVAAATTVPGTVAFLFEEEDR
jgi:hypothetical protein